MLRLSVVLALIGLTSTCIYKGDKYDDGDTWVVRSTFVMRCSVKKEGWSTSVIGCRTPNGAVVEPGQKIHEANTTYECISMGNGKVEIRRTYAFDATSGCEGHKVGESWISERNFMKECTEKGVRIKNCLTDAGISVNVNASLQLSGISYNCRQHDNGTISINREVLPSNSTFRLDNLRPVEVLGPMFKRFRSLGKLLESTIDDSEELEIQRKPKTCSSKGKTYQVDDTWVSENRFTKKCTSTGAIVILNCLISDETAVAVNTEVKIDNQTFKCYRKQEEGRVYLEIITE
ncbi:unnamed protein product [Auanema sp. JU1783]|nr:unnamed protein product [Auanema sp. JU1783]